MRHKHTVNPKVYEWCDEHDVWWVDCLECYRDKLIKRERDPVNKQERGTKNLAKLRTVKGRGKLTLWNPTPDNKTTTTVHFTDADLLVKVHDALSVENQFKFRLKLATLAGLDQMTAFAWKHAEFRQV